MRKLLEWGVFVAVCLAVFVLAGPTSLGGSTSYVVVDGTSMEPTYDHGDLVIARQRDTYDVGDVITYDAPVGVTYRVIHRVTEVTDDGYLTRGDNRDQLDGWIVPFDAVHGSSAVVVPRGGTLVAILRHPPVLVAAFAGWVTLALMTRRERRSAEAADAGQGDSEGPDAEATVVASLGSRLRTAALFTVVGVLGLGAGVLVAHAASLAVDGGTLQTFDLAGPDQPPAPDPDPEDPEREELTITWYEFNPNGRGRKVHRTHSAPFEVDDTYDVADWPGEPTDGYDAVPCAQPAIKEIPDADRYDAGTGFVFEGRTTHAVCLLKVTGPPTAPSETTTADEPEHTPEETS